MLIRFFFALVVLAFQRIALGRCLGCHHYPDLLIYYFIVTIKTLPTDFLDNYAFSMSQQSCTIDLHTDFDKQIITFDVSASVIYVDTSIKVTDTIVNELKHEIYFILMF